MDIDLLGRPPPTDRRSLEIRGRSGHKTPVIRIAFVKVPVPSTKDLRSCPHKISVIELILAVTGPFPGIGVVSAYLHQAVCASGSESSRKPAMA